MKRRNVSLVLVLLTLPITYVLVTAIKDARQAAFYSTARNKLKQLSFAITTFEQIKEQSVFHAALEADQSWRVLLSETFAHDLAEDFIKGESADALSQPTPYYLRDPRETKSASLTSLRAVYFKSGYEDVDGKVSHWIVAFLPMDRVLWTSKATLSQAEFEKILSRKDAWQAKIDIVTESEKVMPAAQFMRKIQRAK